MANLANVQPVVEIICALLSIMVVGFAIRRLGGISAESAAAMNRVVADVTFPALCFRGIVKTDRDVLARGGALVVAGFGILAVAALVGAALAPLVGLRRGDAGGRKGERATFVFAIAVGNWIFLPLPLATRLYGQAGTSAVLLVNVGAQVFLWTFGLLVLRGKASLAALKEIAANPGLWATAAGVGVAFAGRGVGVVGGALEAPWLLPLRTLGTALDMVASITVPLVTIAIGAQLADILKTKAPRGGPLAGVLVGRLVVAPLVTLVLLRLAVARGVVGAGAEAGTLALVAAMPVSLSCGALVQRYGADVALATRGILWTTVGSVATVPAIYALAQWMTPGR